MELVGGMSASHMKDVRISERKALGKGADLRKLIAYHSMYPLEEWAWSNALKVMDPSGTFVSWLIVWGGSPQLGGWSRGEQYFTWYEADYHFKWDSARALCAEVAATRLDFAGLESFSGNSWRTSLTSFFAVVSGTKNVAILDYLLTMPLCLGPCVKLLWILPAPQAPPIL
eukprot:4452440-Amphidinium_carterae.1